MYNSKIKGLGYYVPENVVTNDDLSELMDTSDAWIQDGYMDSGAYRHQRAQIC